LLLPLVTSGLLPFFFRKELGFEVKREEQNNNNNNKKETEKEQNQNQNLERKTKMRAKLA
jgi:hypothetical protein